VISFILWLIAIGVDIKKGAFHPFSLKVKNNYL